jgi:hypothetical protein
VDYRVQPVLESLTDWLSRVPAKGPVNSALFNEGFGLMPLVSDSQRMSDHGAGILALQDLIPVQDDEPPEEKAQEDDVCVWSFGGPLDDEETDQETDEVPVPWESSEGQPAEQGSFYTLTDVAALALMVLVRAFLSFTLTLEIEGKLPWIRRGEQDVPEKP